MKGAALGLSGLVALCLGAAVAAPSAASPLPNTTGLGPAASTNSQYSTFYVVQNPGDNHGSMGRTYTVFKVNAQFRFVNRATGAVTCKSDGSFNTDCEPSFWGLYVAPPGTSCYGTTANVTPLFWAPSGCAVLGPGGDGRVYYDPYPPSSCPGSGGHWLAVELATAYYSSSGAYLPGVLIESVRAGAHA